VNCLDTMTTDINPHDKLITRLFAYQGRILPPDYKAIPLSLLNALYCNTPDNLEYAALSVFKTYFDLTLSNKSIQKKWHRKIRVMSRWGDILEEPSVWGIATRMGTHSSLLSEEVFLRGDVTKGATKEELRDHIERRLGRKSGRQPMRVYFNRVCVALAVAPHVSEERWDNPDAEEGDWDKEGVSLSDWFEVMEIFDYMFETIIKTRASTT
jgi:hypothetical protein